MTAAPGKGYTTKWINEQIRSATSKGNMAVIKGLSGQHAIAVGLGPQVKVSVQGRVGDLFGALNQGAELVLNGDAGRFVGDTMTDGTILVHGQVGTGLAVYQKAGTLVVKGPCSGSAATAMRGGTLVIDGNVGGTLGKGMEGGTVIVTGDVHGDVGEGSNGGRFLVLGTAPLLDDGVVQRKLSDSDREELRGLHREYKFRKIMNIGEALDDGFKLYVRG